MGTGIATIAFITALVRMYNIHKNDGVTDLATEVFEFGSSMIASVAVYIIIMLTL
jgi:hypothetical protein